VGASLKATERILFLVSKLAVANIEGIQSTGVIANVKHYLANNQETNRGTINEGLCCKIRLRRVRPRRWRTSQTSSRLGFESFIDDCDGFRERTGTDAESAFDNARLAADVLREVEDCRLALP
jgi:hypothetical protein